MTRVRRRCAVALAASFALVACDGGDTAPPSAVTGTFWGPIDAQVTLQNLAADDLTVSVPAFAGGPSPINQQDFAFATLAPNGSAYEVTLKTQGPGLACAVYAGAMGTLPIAAGTVHVGCEIVNDLVSRSSDDSVKGTYYESSAPAIGGDAYWGEGRFVAFVSSAAGLGGSTGAHRQIFWRDRLSGETRLISASAAGVEGNADSFAPAISADGLHVAFESYATNLVASDANGVRDVFLWAADGGVLPTGLERVSVGIGGVEANSDSVEATLSADGKVVAFSSSASNLTPGVSGTNTVNVYVRDLTAGTNTLVSADSGGTGVGGSKPALSEDGKRLAFYSFASTIVTGDTNGLWDIFVYDRTSSATTRVSLTSSGSERNQGSESVSRVVEPAISGDGRYVAYATTATNVVAGDTNGLQDVFVVDTQTGNVVRASVANDGTQGAADSPSGQGERVALSYDGTWVAFTSSATNLGAPAGNVLMRNVKTGQTRFVSNVSGGSVATPSMSRTGAYVAYGAGTPLDARFTSTGLFASFTGLANAYFWQ